VHGASDEALARLAAVLCGLPETAALSHRSAAMLLGLPLVGVRPGPVEVTVPGAVPPSRVRQQRVESSGARCPAGDAAPPYPLA
jgi:hypothetical protein